MATIQVGWYPLKGARTLHHTFAHMQDQNQEYAFACYGGTKTENNPGKCYPAKFYEPKWSKKGGICANVDKIKIHPMIAIHLASWSNKIDKKITLYNRRTGGSTGLGDCSGITYSVNGVCHQMCNTILSASNIDDPLNSLINCSPSMKVSKAVYGFRGSLGHDQLIKTFISKLKKYYGKRNIVDVNFDELDMELDKIMKELVTTSMSNLKEYLTYGASPEERMSIIKDMFAGDDQNDDLTEIIFKLDADIMQRKCDFDNLLIRGEITSEQYAHEANNLFTGLAMCYAEVLGETGFQNMFGDLPDKISYDIIDTNILKDVSYESIKEQLKL